MNAEDKMSTLLASLPTSIDQLNAQLIDALEPYAKDMADYTTYSFPIYFGILAAARMIRVGTVGSGSKTALVSQGVQFVHNVFLALQSAYLMYVVYFLYMDTAKIAGLDPVSDFMEIMVSGKRSQSKFFRMALVSFLASKLYETLDTVILILNGKPLLMLHVWHHATTYAAFCTGLFTGAGFWIGMLNSFIHVVMYLYYAKVPGMKVIAKYITSMQIFHLFGGAVWNALTYMNPPSLTQGVRSSLLRNPEEAWRFSADVKSWSAFNAFLCFSYFFLFLAFFSKKYHRNGSIWTLFAAPKGVQRSVLSIQTAVLPKGVCAYLQDQGLLIRTEQAPAEKTLLTTEDKAAGSKKSM
ncbi:unnamed protein product [Amoebophrya sp. A25]|nr:unnamed protein product [Amoebophrya sp. A25]|eukprot:GSA25T00006570001.1